ncbi:MAG TPA: prenyltransferase/squalene oxidase repeat-containing protein [Bryobacterales bacterium]|nr:prenyltransferase/squalene oxidase repeat-containing protein [Bryobacterales bacterium]
MRSVWIGALAVAALLVTWSIVHPDPVRGKERPAGREVSVPVERDPAAAKPEEKPDRPLRKPEEAITAGLEWLVAAQGNDGGWGQDGGHNSDVRAGENLESSGNDVANTAVATLALIRAGHTPTQGKYKEAVRKGMDFILKRVEASPDEGLALLTVTGSQIQRKLGPHIDTFLTSMLLSEIDGEMNDPKVDERVRLALQKTVNKIEKNQQADGSWNLAGGWAPILGTSMASRSLFEAKQKGVDVSEMVLARVDDYTKESAKSDGSGGGVVGGIPGGTFLSGPTDASSAGIALYKGAQVIEQLSRSEGDRKANEAEIAAVTSELRNARFVEGFGSIGGEEFFSYLNISDSLRRAGGKEWNEWNGNIQSKLVRLQNDDGTWAGHHCITGRVAVTSAAILTLAVDQRDGGKTTRASTTDG